MKAIMKYKLSGLLILAHLGSPATQAAQEAPKQEIVKNTEETELSHALTNSSLLPQLKLLIASYIGNEFTQSQNIINTEKVREIYESADGKYVVIWTSPPFIIGAPRVNHTLRIFKRSGPQLQEMQTLSIPAASKISISPDGNYIAVTNSDNDKVILYTLKNETYIEKQKLDDRFVVVDFCIHNNNLSLISLSKSNTNDCVITVYQFKINELRCLSKTTLTLTHESDIFHNFILENGYVFIIQDSQDGFYLRALKMDNQNQYKEISAKYLGLKANSYRFAISPHGEYIAYFNPGDSDKKIQVCQFENEQFKDFATIQYTGKDLRRIYITPSDIPNSPYVYMMYGSHLEILQAQLKTVISINKLPHTFTLKPINAREFIALFNQELTLWRNDQALIHAKAITRKL
jgi:WD40 repeat protein